MLRCSIFVAAGLLVLGCGGKGSGPADLASVVDGGGADVAPATADLMTAAPVQYKVGKGPSHLVAGDLNGDGKLDLVVANLPDDTITALLNKGDGTFTVGMAVPVAIGPQGLALGDLDGDGKLDLVTGNSATAEGVDVLLGKGDGTFKPKVGYMTSPSAFSPVIADFDGDGRQDVATANYNGYNVSVLLGNGDGTLNARIDYTTGLTPSSGPTGLATADLNGDGKLDLVSANHNADDVSVLMNNGDGTFAAPVRYKASMNPNGVVAADVNKDGKTDLVVATGNKFVCVLLGNGDGTFKATSNTMGGARGLAVGDLDGDGNLDVATADDNLQGTSTLLQGKGDGTFTKLASVGLFPSTFPNWVVLADFNGDGRLDLATSNAGTSDVSVILR